MRPYLAIIIDSFRAAFANRVLYVLLGLITVLLLIIAPLHYREVMDWQLQLGRSVRDTDQIIRTLVDSHEDSNRPELGRIWELLPAELKTRMEAHAATEEPIEASESESFSEQEKGPPSGRRRELRTLFSNVVDGLNEIIKQRDFYREGDWKTAKINAEAKTLIAADPARISTERVRRMNRLLMSTAFGDAIQNGVSTTLDFYYAIWQIEILSSNIPHQQFAQSMSENIPWFFDKFVMSIGLFIAIMVTANIIPETFDPGSLNLLLSKPISRWGLLVSKFIGGCVFTAVCATYLMIGAWLWLGIGMGIWDRAILYSIPLYILVFAVYYSVSTLIGIWYRSAILSIVLTAVFWGVCFLVGTVYFWFSNRMENAEFSILIPVEDRVLAVDPIKTISSWQSETSTWIAKQKIFDPNSSGPEQNAIGLVLYVDPNFNLPGSLRPVLDSKTNLVLASQVTSPNSRQVIFSASDANELEFKQCGKFPSETVAVFGSSRGPVLITRSGKMFGFKKDLLKQVLNPENANVKVRLLADAATDSSVFEEFKLASGVPIRRADSADLNQSNDEIAVYRRGELTIFQPDDELGYRKHATVEVDIQTDLAMSCRVRYQGDSIVLALGNGQIILLDAGTLTERKGFLPETRSKIQELNASPDGRWFAVSYGNENLWLLDTEHDEEMKLAVVDGQGSISGVAFNNENQIWVADRTDRVTLYDPDSSKIIERLTPNNDWFTFSHRYILRPLYLFFPKPSETYKLVSYLSNTRDTKYNRNVDLTNTVESMNPWSPLWSGLGFMFTLLFIACVSFHRTDY